MSKKNRVRTDDPVKCIAHSSQTGKPCKNPPMHGGNVCRMHGGSAQHVRRRAAERIALASDPAAAHLIKWMQDDAVPYPVRLAAAKDLLDRADVRGKTTVELEVPAWQQLLDGIVAELPADGAPVGLREFHHPGEDAVLVSSERADEPYAVDNADYGDVEAQGSDLPATWHPPTAEGAHRRAADKPARPVNGDDRPPPARYRPTHSGPRSRRNPRHG